MSAHEHDLRRAAGCLDHAAERAAEGFDKREFNNNELFNKNELTGKPPATAINPEGFSPEKFSSGEFVVVDDASISIAQANRFATALMPVFALFTLLPFVLIWGIPDTDIAINPGEQLPMLLLGALLFPLALLLSAAVHELLHGVGFVLFGGMRWRDVRFGVNWRYLTPYAHIDAVLKAAPYRWSVLLPGLVMGALPAVIGLITGSFLLTFYGFFMLAAAGGDAAVLRAIRKLPADALLRDHPERAGCLVLGRREESADAAVVNTAA